MIYDVAVMRTAQRKAVGFVQQDAALGPEQGFLPTSADVAYVASLAHSVIVSEMAASVVTGHINSRLSAGTVSTKAEWKGCWDDYWANSPIDTDPMTDGKKQVLSMMFERIFEKCIALVYYPMSHFYTEFEEFGSSADSTCNQFQAAILANLRDNRECAEYYEAWKVNESDTLEAAIRAGIGNASLHSRVKSKVMKKRLDFSAAIQKTCEDSGLKAVDFSDRCHAQMSVKAFYNVLFDLIEHLSSNPNDVVFFTQDAAEWIDYFVARKQILTVDNFSMPYNKDKQLSAKVFRGEDYVNLCNTLRDDVAVKQAMMMLTTTSFECCVCFDDLTCAQGVTLQSADAMFVCGHNICTPCARNVTKCPVCRETRLYSETKQF